MNTPWRASALELSAAVRGGATTAATVTRTLLDRIDGPGANLRAFVATWAERATASAEAIDRRRDQGEPLGPLAGVPVACKDNLLVAGEHASAGSRILSGFTAPFSSTAMARLEAAGVVLLGRTNMDEFGMGSTTETSAHGRTHNPFGEGLVAGGSSGGSAAAVAADLCPLAIGSDTGGSIRQPASLCGVTGLKPTYGRVSRRGLIAYATSLDCVGAIARHAADLAAWLDAVSGPDEGDATTVPAMAAVSPTLPDAESLRGLRIGVPAQLNGPGVSAEVLQATAEAQGVLRSLGAELVACELPNARYAVAAYYLIATTEAASNLSRYDGVHYGLRLDDRDCTRMTTATRSAGFGDEVQLRILLGTFASSVGFSDRYYGRAQEARRALANDFARAFRGCDLLLSPTSPTAAFPFGQGDEDPLTRYLWDALTVPASLAGLPALSMPCGSTPAGLPIGLQLMAPAGADGLLLRTAHCFQRHTDHHLRRPLP